MAEPVVILDTVTLRHFIVLGRVGLLKQWLGGDLLIPEAVHRELLRGVEAHDPQALSADPDVAQQRSARFRAYLAWGIQVLPSLAVDTLSAKSVRLFAALETQACPPVHAGKKEVILWAYERGHRICTDDRGAYLTIRALQQGLVPSLPARPALAVVGTPGLLAEHLQRGLLNEAEVVALWAEVQEVWRRAPKLGLLKLLEGEYW